MNFIKTFLASLLAFIVANFAIIFLFFAFVAGFAALAGMSSKAIVEPRSVLKIDLAESIVDQPVVDPMQSFNPMAMNIEKSVSNMQVMRAIEAAAQDENIEGIYINITGTGTASAAMLEEVRSYIETFKNEGKFVLAYGENYTQGGYYLASVADSIFLNPAGEMEWRGLAAQVMFYKGLLDKLGVEPQVFRHGTFKSAIEPYILNKMSPANRTQMETYINSIWGTIVEGIADSRNLSIDSLNIYANELSAMMAEDALEKRMIDALMYEDEVEDVMREKLELDADEEISFVTLGEYIAANPYAPSYSDNKIEVIYAEGQIVQGPSAKGTLGSATLAEQLAEARMDEGLVLATSIVTPNLFWRAFSALNIIPNTPIEPVSVVASATIASAGAEI